MRSSFKGNRALINHPNGSSSTYLLVFQFGKSDAFWKTNEKKAMNPCFILWVLPYIVLFLPYGYG